jgi:hypothetical protein
VALGNVAVEDAEFLARVILTERYVRKDLKTGVRFPKPEAFLPFKMVELSVIRHRELVEGELWEICLDVATKRARPLVGRGDSLAFAARAQKLDVVPSEGPDDPRNHADVVGWPPEKAAKMSLALEIAAGASFAAGPVSS